MTIDTIHFCNLRVIAREDADIEAGEPRKATYCGVGVPSRVKPTPGNYFGFIESRGVVRHSMKGK